MVDFGGALKVAFAPKTLGQKIGSVNFLTGLVLVIAFKVLLLVIDLVFTGAGAVVEGQDMIYPLAVKAVASSVGVIITLISFLVLAGLVTVLASLLHKETNFGRLFGALSYGVVPLFFVGILTNIVTFTSLFLGTGLTSLIQMVDGLLTFLSFVWFLIIGVVAVQNVNKLGFFGAFTLVFVCYLIGVLVAAFIGVGLGIFLAPLIEPLV